MYTGDTRCHSSTTAVNAPCSVAFDYLSDGVAQGDWTLGSMERKKIGDHLYSGISIFNGAELYVRIDADPARLMIYYHVGTDVEDLQPRNVVRVLPGAVIGENNDTCLVTLLSWRNALADDVKWKLTCVSHETEMFIIKNRIEKLATSS
jgi:hypothetical protein